MQESQAAATGAHVVVLNFFRRRKLDPVCKEAKEAADPQQHREATEQLLTELDPLWRRLGGSQFVRTISLEDDLRLRHRQPLDSEQQFKPGKGSQVAPQDSPFRCQ